MQNASASAQNQKKQFKAATKCIFLRMEKIKGWRNDEGKEAIAMASFHAGQGRIRASERRDGRLIPAQDDNTTRVAQHSSTSGWCFGAVWKWTSRLVYIGRRRPSNGAGNLVQPLCSRGCGRVIPVGPLKNCSASGGRVRSMVPTVSDPSISNNPIRVRHVSRGLNLGEMSLSAYPCLVSVSLFSCIFESFSRGDVSEDLVWSDGAPMD